MRKPPAVNVVDRVTKTHYIVDECVICGDTHRHGAVDSLKPFDVVEREAHCPVTVRYLLKTDETTTWEDTPKSVED